MKNENIFERNSSSSNLNVTNSKQPQVNNPIMILLKELLSMDQIILNILYYVQNLNDKELI
jgi:hypothetical protein